MPSSWPDCASRSRAYSRSALQQPVAGRPVRRRRPRPATCPPARQQSSTAWRDRPPPATPRRRLERPAAGEDREPRRQALLGVRQQVVAPVERRPQRLLARQRAARAAGQQAEALVQPGANASHGESAHARRGQLERQRDAVEPPADLVAAPRCPAAGRSADRPQRARREQLSTGRVRRHVVGLGHGQRRQPRPLAGQVQRLAAGGQDGEVGQRAAAGPPARPPHRALLAVVEQQQQALRRSTSAMAAGASLEPQTRPAPAPAPPGPARSRPPARPATRRRRCHARIGDGLRQARLADAARAVS